MATLEKIRKRSVLLIVIIGAALLAFILGDALTNGRTLFGNGSTVAELGDAKVDISEYQQYSQMLSGEQDNSAAMQNIIDQLIDEKLLDQAADKMGIEVSDEALTYFITEIPLQPTQSNGIAHQLAAVNQFLSVYGEGFMQALGNQAAGSNLYSLRYWHDVIFAPEKYGVKGDMSALQQGWLAMEKQAKSEIRRMLYLQLLSGMYHANALEKQATYAENNDITNIEYAYMPYPTDLSAYKVSDKELQDEYAKTKNRFRLKEDTKTVGILAYSVTPSDADKKKAAEIKKQTLTALNNGTKLGKDLLNAGVHSSKVSGSASSLGAMDPRFASFLNDSTSSNVGVFENNGSFIMIKMVGAPTMANDSVKAASIYVDNSKLDAVKADIAAGLSLDSIKGKYSAEELNIQDNDEMMPLQNMQFRSQLQSAPGLVEQLDTVAAGALLTAMSDDQMTSLAYVKATSPKVPVYNLEVVEYNLVPSKATVEAAEAAMSKYANANNTPSKFKAGAQKAGYTYINQKVTGSTPGVNGYSIPGNRLINWVMTDGEAGQLSEVMTNDNNEQPIIFIALVEGEYEDFLPYNDTYVKSQLENTIQKRKAADAMVKQYSGKGDINATAQAMNGAAVNTADITFAGGQVNIGKSALARIAAMQPSNKVVVLKGDNGVYAVTVKSKTPAASKMTKEDGQAIDSQYMNKYLRSNLSNLLRGNNRKNNRLFEMTGTR
ncbi:MAG: SurA N-terminal domain-containing protein [Muribaculaceae bacterium]|nr:SurA N-terminal domain-containing protein [Muribaculaceae bacterium]